MCLKTIWEWREVCWSVDKMGNELIIVETDLWVPEASLHYFLYLCLFLKLPHNKHIFKMFIILISTFIVVHYTILFFSVFI